MSKGIIVVDMPRNCMECKCRLDFGGGSYCGAESKFLDDWEFDLQNEKPGWCPIKPIPTQKDIKKAHTFTDLGFINGHNACIDELLKGGVE